MKYLLFFLLLSFVDAAAQLEPQNWSTMGLKGRVKTITEQTFTKKFEGKKDTMYHTGAQYNFDQTGNLKSIQYFVVKNNEAVITEQTLYTYSKPGHLVARQYIDTLNRVLIYDEARSYGTAGRVMEVNSRWRNVESIFRYGYDQNGRLAAKTRSKKNKKDPDLTMQYNLRYYYNDNGLLACEVDLANKDSTILQYNNNQQLVNKRIYRLSGYYVSTTEFKYDDHGSMNKVEYRPQGGVYDTRYYNYTYDANGNWITKDEAMMENMPYNKCYRTIVYY